jgi:hypothetical protein
MSKKKNTKPVEPQTPSWTKPTVLKKVSAFLHEATELPAAAFEELKEWKVGDIVTWVKKLELQVKPRQHKGRQAAKGQTEATSELDGTVLSLIRSIGRKRKDRLVVMKDLAAKLDDYSDQQIRRALVRLTSKKSIKAHGATKDKTYEAA